MPKQLFTKFQVSIEEYLIEQGFSRVESALAGQLSMRGKIVTNNKEFDTLIKINHNVPASHPKFYTINNDMVFYQPHIERPAEDKEIGILTGMCFQQENEKVYYNNPQELIHNALNKYEQLCFNLSSNTFNKKVDFLQEFDSYWPKNKPNIYMHLNREPKDKSLLHLILLKSSNGHQQAILYDDIKEINNYVEFSKYDVLDKFECPYIDIGSNFSLPFPSTYKDLRKLFNKSGHIKFLKKLLSNKSIFSILFIGVNLPNKKKHYIAVSLLDIEDEKLIDAQNKYQVFFADRYQNIHFDGIHIKSIQRRWLMQRGGNDKTKNVSENNFTVAILGCGSIGSNLAYKLCKSGVSNIILVDPSNLESSNIGRHFLGMNNVGTKKVDGMQRILQSQFIGMNIKVFSKQAQECINEFKNANLIISAIGSDEPSVEPYLAELVINKQLPPMLTCWLEANAMAGHSFYVDELTKTNSYEQTTDVLSILKHDFASSLMQSEVGCNSDYMPYSHLSADEHINRMAQFIVDIILDKQIKRAMSSYGDITPYKDQLLYKAEANSIRFWSDDEFKI